MDETILEKALAGELEEEGFENIFLSELGWADYLDKNAKSSYNMNERPSLASDGYYTAGILDSPVEGEAPDPPLPVCFTCSSCAGTKRATQSRAHQKKRDRLRHLAVARLHPIRTYQRRDLS
eukprot:scaffold139413_cov35-Tisochrysis_lutea.AAC.3